MGMRNAQPKRMQIPFELQEADPAELPKSKEREVVLLVAELLLAAANADANTEMEHDQRENS